MTTSIDLYPDITAAELAHWKPGDRCYVTGEGCTDIFTLTEGMGDRSVMLRTERGTMHGRESYSKLHRLPDFEFETVSSTVYRVDMTSSTVERLGARAFPPRKVICGADRFKPGPGRPVVGEQYIAHWAGTRDHMRTSPVTAVWRLFRVDMSSGAAVPPAAAVDGKKLYRVRARPDADPYLGSAAQVDAEHETPNGWRPVRHPDTLGKLFDLLAY